MSVQFNTVGFINFNTEHNTILKSGAITVSFTSSRKNKDGEYETHIISTQSFLIKFVNKLNH